MNKIIEDLFKNRRVIASTLVPYGFTMEGDAYVFRKKIASGSMLLSVFVKGDNVSTEVLDLDTCDLYTLFLVPSAMGSFVGKVKSEYEEILANIRDNCFEFCVFKKPQTNRLIGYAKDTFNDNLEYLWEKTPEYAVLRRKDSQKWYATVMKLPACKLKINSDKQVEVVNLKVNPLLIPDIIDNKTFFNAYHMNKKSWITVMLDDTICDNELFKLLQSSYDYAKK